MSTSLTTPDQIWKHIEENPDQTFDEMSKILGISPRNLERLSVLVYIGSREVFDEQIKEIGSKAREA